MKRLGMVAALVMLHASPMAAQEQHVTIDASVLRGTVGYARQAGAKAYVGLEIGFGFPQLDRTLRPAEDSTGGPDFEEYLHVGAFVRLVPSDRFEVDLGVRGSVADLWECTVSDCWPATFAGMYVQPMIGWSRIKFGPRLTAGWIREGKTDVDGTTGVIAVNPFTARLTIPF